MSPKYKNLFLDWDFFFNSELIFFLQKLNLNKYYITVFYGLFDKCLAIVMYTSAPYA